MISSLAMAAWPEVLAAQEHARGRVEAAGGEFETLDKDTAGEIEAIAAQIIPSTDGPGAREAGVIYFIDRALATFARDEREAYRTGMAELQEKRKEMYPESASIAGLSDEQQKALIRSIEHIGFFELLRTHTVLGFLGDPRYGGNRGKVGWRQIGFEGWMAYQPPFGYYDAEVSREKKG
jgi:gluconate 2-dehydrogenase gamma chain